MILLWAPPILAAILCNAPSSFSAPPPPLLIIIAESLTCYFHMWWYQVFARKLTWYLIGVYIMKHYKKIATFTTNHLMIILIRLFKDLWRFFINTYSLRQSVSSWRKHSQIFECEIRQFIPSIFYPEYSMPFWSLFLRYWFVLSDKVFFSVFGSLLLL